MVERDSGRGLAGALVWRGFERDSEVTSDEEGYFRLEGLPLGRSLQIVRASLAGFGEGQAALVWSVREGGVSVEVRLATGRLVRAEGHAAAVFDFPARELETQLLDLGKLPLERPMLVAGCVVERSGRPPASHAVFASIEPRERDRLGRLEGGVGFAPRAHANRHFDPDGNFLDAFFCDENGNVPPDMLVTVRELTTSEEVIELRIPGLP